MCHSELITTTTVVTAIMTLQSQDVPVDSSYIILLEGKKSQYLVRGPVLSVVVPSPKVFF